MDPEHLLDVSFAVVVCGWCGDLFGIWLELGVPLGVFFYWIPVVATHPSLPTCSFISTTTDITAMPVKASQNQTGSVITRPLYLKLKTCLTFGASPMLSTVSSLFLNVMIDFIFHNQAVCKPCPHSQIIS